MPNLWKHQNIGSILLVLLLWMLPAGLSAQSRTVVSNSLAISNSDATLHLEFAGGGTLDLALSDGAVFIDGEQVGSYTRGDDLDAAWRSFLGQITPLDDGPLGEALRNWDPPTSLSGGSLDVARLLDQAMESSLALDSPALVQIEASDGDLSVSASVNLSQLQALSEASGLREILETLRNLDLSEIKVYVGEDVLIEADTEIVGTLVVLQGDLTIAGRVRGDVIVSGGVVEFLDEGHVDGTIRLSDARMIEYEARNVSGGVISFDEDDEATLENRIRVTRTSSHSFFRPFRALGHGISALVGDLIQFLILSTIAFGVIFFAKDNLEVVAQTARYSPARAGMVGFAGAFLFLPVWVLGCVALAISIVGIIALPFWVILFPIVVACAAGLGYMAVARNIGEWVAGQRFRGFEWVQASNTLYATVSGIGALIAFSVVGHLVGILPIVGLLKGLFLTVGSIATAVATFIGFGAVLITRGGRRTEFYGGGWPGGMGDSGDGGAEDEVVVAEEVVDADAAQSDSTDADGATSDTEHDSKEGDNA